MLKHIFGFIICEIMFSLTNNKYEYFKMVNKASFDMVVSIITIATVKLWHVFIGANVKCLMFDLIEPEYDAENSRNETN